MTTQDFVRLAERAMAATEQEGWAADTFLNLTSVQPGEAEASANAMAEATTKATAVEWHPLIPFLPRNTRVLFLGSFPPQRKRWCMDFFYPNFINDHWRIEGLVFHQEADHFVDSAQKTFRLPDIVRHLKQQGIGFFDTALAVKRLEDNAADKFLEVVVPTDIRALTEGLPELRAIVTTGEKATATIVSALEGSEMKGKRQLPAVNTSTPLPLHGVELYRLPSSSRAYPMALRKKADAYGRMFERYL